MKNKILFSVLATILIFTANAEAEIVNIPDNVFKTYLLANTDINTNGDNEIQKSEAAAFTGTIDVTSTTPSKISDMTGLEAFTALTELKARGNNLTTLDLSKNTALIKLNVQSNQLTSLDLSNNIHLEQLECSYNQLTSLNISANVALKSVNCGFNQISSIDVSNNTALAFLTVAENKTISSLDVSNNTLLRYLSCYTNQLTSLDVSNNPALEQLACGKNQLSSLDISRNPALFYLACFNNQLTSLNIANGNNHNFTTLNTTGNSGLDCIEVDDEDYSNTNWTGGSFTKDASASFSESCNPLNINFTESTKPQFIVYPNPSNGLVHFSEKANVQVVNAQGQIIADKKNTNSFDFSNQPTSIYSIIFIDDLGKTIQQSKFTKE
jgi:Leucine-rich repeat (LRR) protein